GTFSQQEAVRIVVADRPFTTTSSHSRVPSQIQDTPLPFPETGTITPAADIVSFSTTSNPSSAPSSRPVTPTTPSRPSRPPSRPKTPVAPTSAPSHQHHASGSSIPHLKTHGEVGRALVNYSSQEIARIKGLQSTDIVAVLGYADSEYVALREN